MADQSLPPQQVTLEQREWEEIQTLHGSLAAALHLLKPGAVLDSPQVIDLLVCVEARFDRSLSRMRERFEMEERGRKDAE